MSRQTLLGDIIKEISGVCGTQVYKGEENAYRILMGKPEATIPVFFWKHGRNRKTSQ
jgi:hypothetical protein